MFAKINISLFVFTIILMSITWQNVLHHIHSEAALLCIIIFLYVYYKNLRKNIIKNITKSIKPHPHARFDISFSKLDNSDVFFDLLPS